MFIDLSGYYKKHILINLESDSCADGRVWDMWGYYNGLNKSNKSYFSVFCDNTMSINHFE